MLVISPSVAILAHGGCLIPGVSLLFLLQWMGVSSHHQFHQDIAIHLISSVCFSLSLCLSLSLVSLVLDRWDNASTLHIIKPSIHCSLTDIITPGHCVRERMYVLLAIAQTPCWQALMCTYWSGLDFFGIQRLKEFRIALQFQASFCDTQVTHAILQKEVDRKRAKEREREIQQVNDLN